MAKRRNSIFVPVHLKIENKAEHFKRLTNKSRLVRYKSLDAKNLDAAEITLDDQNLL